MFWANLLLVQYMPCWLKLSGSSDSCSQQQRVVL